MAPAVATLADSTVRARVAHGRRGG